MSGKSIKTHARRIANRLKAKKGSRQAKALYIIAAFFVGIFLFNYVMLQSPLSDVVEGGADNKGISVYAYYRHGFMTGEINFDIRGISNENSMLDVTRVFLKFAEKIQSRNYSKVHLLYRGQDRFFLMGDYFKTLGIEFSKQNPMYTVRTLPENVFNPDGSKAFEHWSGGLLGVLGKQMDDFKSFQKKWYMDAVFEGMGIKDEKDKADKKALVSDDFDPMTDERRLIFTMESDSDNSDLFGFRCDDGKITTIFRHRYYTSENSVSLNYRFDKEAPKKERFAWLSKPDFAVKFDTSYFMDKALRADRLVLAVDSESASIFSLSAVKDKLKDFGGKCKEWQEQLKKDSQKAEKVK